MKFSSEQIKEIQAKMANAKNPEDIVKIAKELGEDISVDDVAKFIEEHPNARKPLSEDELEHVIGGEQVDIPQYEIIRDYYKEKGPNSAFILCIYYIPSPICYEIIQVIEKEES